MLTRSPTPASFPVPDAQCLLAFPAPVVPSAFPAPRLPPIVSAFDWQPSRLSPSDEGVFPAPPCRACLACRHRNEVPCPRPGNREENARHHASRLRAGRFRLSRARVACLLSLAGMRQAGNPPPASGRITSGTGGFLCGYAMFRSSKSSISNSSKLTLSSFSISRSMRSSSSLRRCSSSSIRASFARFASMSSG